MLLCDAYNPRDEYFGEKVDYYMSIIKLLNEAKAKGGDDREKEFFFIYIYLSH